MNHPFSRTGFSRARSALATSLSAAILGGFSILGLPAASAGEIVLQAIPCGSGGTGTSLAIELAQDPVRVLVSGCDPGARVVALFGDRPAAIDLPGGITVRVRPDGRFACAAANGAGCAELGLPADQGAVGDTWYVQAFATEAASGTVAATPGMRLEYREAAGAIVSLPAIEMPPVLVEEIGRLLDARLLEQALDRALNSTGDSVGLDLGGNLSVPVYPGVTAGGQIAFKVQVSRGIDPEGRCAYDLSAGGDVAATAGVGAGVAGASLSLGGGLTVIWRFASVAEAARAVRCFALLHAIGPRLELTCTAIDRKLAELDGAIDSARSAADSARSWVRSRVPWRSNRVVQAARRLADDLRDQRRAEVDGAMDLVDQLVSVVADARTFLDEHVLGVEVRAATAVEAKIGVGGIGDEKEGGEWTCANFGASLGGSIRREYASRLDHFPGSGATCLGTRVTFTRSLAIGAGCAVGVDLAAKRTLEVASKATFDGNGLRCEDLESTVKLGLDGRLMGALGFVVAGKYGVGGEVTAEMSLRDLLACGEEAAAILMGDDDAKAVRLLRSVPVTFKVQGRVEAELTVGIGVKIAGVFEGGVGGTANFTDRGGVLEYCGLPTGAQLENLLIASPLPEEAYTTLEQVKQEVGTVMSGR